MAKRKDPYLIENLEISDISSEGKAVGRHEGLVVFVEGAVPGDIADVLVYRKKSNFAEARLSSLIKASENRIKPVCKHFGICGGCKWQHLSYESQLQFKQKYVHDAFTRIGKLNFAEPLPIIGCKETYFYRNKLEFSFSNKRWLSPEEMKTSDLIPERNALGFHIPGMFDKILDIDECHLQSEPGNEIRNAIREYAIKHGLSFFDIRQQSGFLRTLMVRNSSLNEWMVILTVFEWLEKELFALLDHVKQLFPQITSLQYAHNPKGNDTLTDLDIRVYHGCDHILEEMEGLKFKISPRSFYQTNSVQAYELYKITREFAAIQSHETVYDLYTGTGTIANFVARQAHKVLGIEYVEDAVRDAFENSKLNGLSNTDFYAGDMKKVLNLDFIEKHGQPQVIICDPPRAGMEAEVIKAIIAANPERIVYVSCNPATQARDLALMQDHYNIARLQAVDMFPQTAHVENVCLLLRK